MLPSAGEYHLLVPAAPSGAPELPERRWTVHHRDRSTYSESQLTITAGALQID